MPETFMYYKKYIRCVIFVDWSQVAQEDISTLSDHYTRALEWLDRNNIYSSDLTSEGLLGMVASHSILFEQDSDLLAFTLMYSDLLK